MRRALFIAVVILVLVTGLPVLMGMGDMAACDYCGPGVLLPLTCLIAVAASAVLLPELLRTRLRLYRRAFRLVLFAGVFQRPPKLG